VSDRRRIVRAVGGIRGEVEFEASVEPRFDYGRRSHRLHVDGTAAVFEANDQRLQLTSVAALERDSDDVRSRFTVRAGDTSGFVLESGASGSPHQIGDGEVIRLFLDTGAYWQRWPEQSSYRGRWREAVERSAITLKLMIYAPSGGLVAAPTAGLPEQVGGSRNWDYRYTWVRDGAFSVFALLGLGFTEEATAFGEWLRARVDERAGEGSGPLKIMYRIDGSSEVTEETLDHPRRLHGLASGADRECASDQLQLDVYGEAMNSIHALDSGALRDWGVGHEGWQHIVAMIDWLCAHWHDPDEGIWETRGGRRHIVYGQLMSWVALDRAIRMAASRSRPRTWTAGAARGTASTPRS
jgi:GH15 family glucan-1,4-alpha-glucosidase